MRAVLLMIPFVVGAVALAQEKEKTESDPVAVLILKLGHEDYAVREAATRKLIELGDKAVPALEDALKSTDLEVRMRAGRALRAIRGKKTGDEEETGAAGVDRFTGPGRRSRNRAVKIEMADNRVKVTIRTVIDGKEEERTYEGASLEELKRKHPELEDALGGVRFRFGPGLDPFKFDMDRFWKDWERDFNNNSWKRLQEEQKRRMERLKRWLDKVQAQNRAQMERFRRGGASGHLLGVRATRPDDVLDAQLELRGRGLVIHGVEVDTLAAGLGLSRYDVLLELNNLEIRSTDDVARALRDRKKGAPLTAKVVRRGRELGLSTKD